MVLRLVADLIGLLALSARPLRSIEAENLVLWRQLALFKERGVKPRRIDARTRLRLAWLSTLCDWRSCVIVVRPETIVRWHRAAWRLFWRYYSRPGRPPILLELRQLIRRMASDNPLWGEERIANELLVKLGVRGECLDWMIPLSEAHLRSILRSWAEHYNRGRPHSMLGPGVPGSAARSRGSPRNPIPDIDWRRVR